MNPAWNLSQVTRGGASFEIAPQQEEVEEKEVEEEEEDANNREKGQNKDN